MTAVTMQGLFAQWTAASAEEAAAQTVLYDLYDAVRRQPLEIPPALFHKPSDDAHFSGNRHAVRCTPEWCGGAPRLWYGDARSQVFIEGARTVLAEQKLPELPVAALTRIDDVQVAYRAWTASLRLADATAGIPAAHQKYDAARELCAQLRRQIAWFRPASLQDAIMKARVVAWTHCGGLDEMRDQLCLSMCSEGEDGPTAPTLALILACDLSTLEISGRTALEHELAIAEGELAQLVR